MISKYSLRQRGRSYAHLAQLLGASKPGIAGLVCAATITKDYAGQVLYGRKKRCGHGSGAHGTYQR